MLPPLRDAVVRWIGDATITISGFEQDSTSKKCTQQAWLARLITDERQKHLEAPPNLHRAIIISVVPPNDVLRRLALCPSC